jgi:hypothetical protein
MVSLCLPPLVGAQEIAGSNTATSAVAIATSSANQDTERQHAALHDGWWKFPDTTGFVNSEAGSALVFDQTASSSGQGTWTRGGKIMTIVGAALAGAGVIMMATYEEPTTPGTHIDWKLTGAIWTAGGAALAIIGLTRRR